MNNNEDTTPNKDQEQKIDNEENNIAEPITENSLEKKIEELNDKLLRSLAENQNLRKIHEKEREDLIKYSSSSFAREILNLADNLEEPLVYLRIILNLRQMNLKIQCLG